MAKLKDLIGDFVAANDVALRCDTALAEQMRLGRRAIDESFDAQVAESLRFDRYMTEREAPVVDAQVNAIRQRSLTEGADVRHVNHMRYPKINGMEGPFRYANGAILYWDRVTQSYFNMEENRVLSSSEALEAIGLVDDLMEDGNRSDSELAFFFDNRDLAKMAFGVAQKHGLVEGEVWFDKGVDPAFGMGRYAVRFAPHVRYEKADTFLAIMNDLSEYVVEEDVDQYGWVKFLTEEYLTEYGDKGDAAKKISKADRALKAKMNEKPASPKMPKTGKNKYGGMDPEEWQKSVSGSVKGYPFDYNPFHDNEDGEFSSPASMISKGGVGSQSYKKSWSKSKSKIRKKDGKPYLFMMATKLPCGRAARRNDVPPEQRYRRCWDGKQPKWAVGAKGA